MNAALFEGSDSLRSRGERFALWCCLLAAPVTIAIASAVFPGVSFSEFVLLIVGGLAFISISRGKLIGSSIRIDERQLPELHAVAYDVAQRLGMPMPQIFVRDDPFVPIAAVGIGEPYALIISSQYYEHLRRGELAFLIAREFGHIAAGHTRFTSLLSASGRENPLVALVFGAWLRRTEYTADRVGLLCSESIEDALGGISISTYHSIGRRVDMRAIAEQRRELQADASLRVGEWTASMPYATNRLDALRIFSASPLAGAWRNRLASPLPAAPVRTYEPDETVARRDCAPLVRRIAAIAIDLLVIEAILQAPVFENVAPSAAKLDDPNVPHVVKIMLHHLPVFEFGTIASIALIVFFAYSAILVSLSGQTLGMMVMELRVVTVRYTRPTIVQSFWRYAAGLMCSLFAIALVGFFVRVHPHDRISRTRLVRGRKLTA
ncbi:MAG: RDD family protein [Candidatus Eremiobacteraeota bacterium]|nr:RDD family protein [Candidatus Eremiobacteraeota bacterium]